MALPTVRSIRSMKLPLQDRGKGVKSFNCRVAMVYDDGVDANAAYKRTSCNSWFVIVVVSVVVSRRRRDSRHRGRPRRSRPRRRSR